MKTKPIKVKTLTPRIKVSTPSEKKVSREMFLRGMGIVPSDITLTIKQPEIVEAVKALIAAAMAHVEREATTHDDHFDDPHETRRLDLEAVRNDIDRDRQRLAWAEFELRKAEWEERLRETRERLAKEEKRQRDEAIARGDVYDVWLVDKGAQMIQVIKAVREATNLGLKEAKDIVDMCPSIVKKFVLRTEADCIRTLVTIAGGKVELRKVGGVLGVEP